MSWKERVGYGQDVDWSSLNNDRGVARAGQLWLEKSAWFEQTRPNICTGLPVVRAWAANIHAHAMQSTYSDDH